MRLIKFLELFLPAVSLLLLASVYTTYYPKKIYGFIISGRDDPTLRIHTFDWFISSKCSSIFGFENWFGCDSRRPSILVAKFPDFNPELGTFPTLPR